MHNTRVSLREAPPGQGIGEFRHCFDASPGLMQCELNSSDMLSRKQRLSIVKRVNEMNIYNVSRMDQTPCIRNSTVFICLIEKPKGT